MKRTLRSAELKTYKYTLSYASQFRFLEKSFTFIDCWLLKSFSKPNLCITAGECFWKDMTKRNFKARHSKPGSEIRIELFPYGDEQADLHYTQKHYTNIFYEVKLSTIYSNSASNTSAQPISNGRSSTKCLLLEPWYSLQREYAFTEIIGCLS